MHDRTSVEKRKPRTFVSIQIIKPSQSWAVSRAAVSGVKEGCDSCCGLGYAALVRDQGAAEGDAADVRES
jgi:hypothetical protein